MDPISFSHVRHYRKICNGYMAAGARGISVIFSSGDNGVHARDDPSSCSNNTFVVQFPASCPYGVCTSAHVARRSPLTLNAVTTVGSSQGFPETAAPFSAGGFSNTFDRPAYQDIAVTEFLSTIPPDFPGVFQRTGRAYPDVAMQGVNYQTFDGGNLTHGSGTSASAPAFASLIALLNARLGTDGLAPLGFLNRGSCCARSACAQALTRVAAFIYGVAGPAGAFNDVTVGSNTAVGAQECNPANTTAFSAVTGWDATTGQFVVWKESVELTTILQDGVPRTLRVC
jgi:tripeptidyl-peptidase-1